MEEIPAYIDMLSYLFVSVIYMLSVPLETTRGEIVKTLADLNLMGRALLANFVIIPIFGILIAGFFDLPPDIKTGFLLLAMAPGGLLALQFARISNGNRIFAVALLFVFCLLAILITPVLVLSFFHREGAGKLPFAWLMLLLVLLIVVPALVGRGLQTVCIPQHAPKLGLWLGRLSRVVIFIIAAVTAGRYRSPAVKLMGTNGIVAIVLLILCAWGVGWFMGGPEIKKPQSAGDQQQHAQRWRLLAHSLQLLRRNGGLHTDAGIQRHHDPDEYGVCARHRPRVPRRGRNRDGD